MTDSYGKNFKIHPEWDFEVIPWAYPFFALLLETLID